MPTVNHTVSMYLHGPGQVRHHTDMVVNYAGTNVPIYRHNVMEEDYQIIGWDEWTLDSSKDFDGLWPSQGPSTGSGGNIGTNYLTRSGNELATKFWDWQPNPSRTGLSQSYEIWHVRGSENPTDYLDVEDTGNPDATFKARSNWNIEIFIDSNGAAWTLWWNRKESVQIQKLNTTTNSFEWVVDRTCVEWATRYAISKWKAIQDGDKLHIVWMDHNENASQDEEWKFYYSQWDMGTESWNVQDELVRDISSYVDAFLAERGSIDIVVRSGGEVVVWHPGPERTQGTLTRAQHEYSRRTGTDTWVNATWINGETNWRTEYYHSTFKCVLGDNDRIHFFYSGYDGSNFKLYHRSLSNINVLDTEQLVESDPSVNVNLNTYAGNSTVTRLDGADTYIYLFKPWNDGQTDNNIRYWKLKSEAIPTIIGTTFAHSQGLTHRSADQQFFGSQALPFTSLDGTVNFFRGEYDIYTTISPGDRWHQIHDGLGGFIYTQKLVTGDFDSVRQMFGRYQEPRGEVTQGINWTYPRPVWEWCWPHVVTGDGTQGNLLHSGGHFVKDNQDYFFWFTIVLGYSGKLKGLFLFVHPAKDLPSVKATHVTDMILKPRPIDHTTDMRIVALGGTQIIDHFIDMVVVARLTETHDIDMIAVDVRTKDHTVDMLLSLEVEFTVAVVTSFSVNVDYTLETPPPIQATKLRDIVSYETGTRGSSYSGRKKRRIDRD